MAEITTDLTTSIGIATVIQILGPVMTLVFLVAIGIIVVAFRHGGVLEHYFKARQASDKDRLTALETHVKQCEEEQMGIRRELDEERGRSRLQEAQLRDAFITIGEQRGLIMTLQSTIRSQQERVSGLAQAFKIARGSP